MSPPNYIQSPTTAAEPSSNVDRDFQLNFNVEIELDNLAELIINSTGVPLTDLALVDRDLLLCQLKQIKENLPPDLATAVEIANRKQQIVTEAKGYAALVVKSAEEQAHKLLQDSAIVRQAELDGAKIRLKIERECQELMQMTQSKVLKMRQQAIAECQSVQSDADSYADGVLEDIEQRLRQMLAIVQNGRQQLEE